MSAPTHNRNRITANRLRALSCTTVVQDDDHEVTFTFDVADPERVATIVKPRRRRHISEAKRQRLAALSKQHGFQLHQPERSRRPLTPANAST